MSPAPLTVLCAQWQLRLPVMAGAAVLVSFESVRNGHRVGTAHFSPVAAHSQPIACILITSLQQPVRPAAQREENRDLCVGRLVSDVLDAGPLYHH